MANKFIIATLLKELWNEVNAGLSAYHLAEQTTGIHKMTFELIDTNNNIHYLTQTFSVFNEGERPVTPDSYRRNQYSSTTTTTTVPVTYNTSANSYTETSQSYNKLRLLMSWLRHVRAA